MPSVCECGPRACSLCSSYTHTSFSSASAIYMFPSYLTRGATDPQMVGARHGARGQRPESRGLALTAAILYVPGLRAKHAERTHAPRGFWCLVAWATPVRSLCFITKKLFEFNRKRGC
jgi:hypothetical protein